MRSIYKVIGYSAVMLIVFVHESIAQNIHFSQFYQNIHAVNPAVAAIDGPDYEAAAIAKQQWSSVVPYRTAAISARFALLRNNPFPRSHFNVGINYSFDTAGSPSITTSNISPFISFQKKIGKTQVGIGAAYHLVARRLSHNDLSFNSQWNGDDYDTSIDSGETFINPENSYIYFSAATHLAWQLNDEFTVQGGFAAHQINQPAESFITYSDSEFTDNKRGLLYQVHVLAHAKLAQWSIQPGVFYQIERKAQEVVIGSNFAKVNYTNHGYKDTKETAFYMGLWYRHLDALILLMGYRYNSYKFMFSYDVNFSELNAASKWKGGPEISFVYEGRYRNKKGKLYCPRF